MARILPLFLIPYLVPMGTPQSTARSMGAGAAVTGEATGEQIGPMLGGHDTDKSEIGGWSSSSSPETELVGISDEARRGKGKTIDGSSADKG